MRGADEAAALCPIGEGAGLQSRTGGFDSHQRLVNVLVVSDVAWPSHDGEQGDDGDFVLVVRPHDPLFGHRFDLIVAPSADRGSAREQVHYQQWWVLEVQTRLNPNGKVVKV